MKNRDNIFLHPIKKTKKDVTDILNIRMKEFKEVAYNLLSDGKSEIFDSSLRLKLYHYANDREILQVLQKLEILEKIAYNKYRLLIKNESDIETIFSNVKFEANEPYTYSQIIEHVKLDKRESVVAQSKEELKIKINAIIEDWEFEWKLIEPEFELNKLENILQNSINSHFSLDNLIDKQSFSINKPVKPNLKVFEDPEPKVPKSKMFGVSKKEKRNYEQEKEKWQAKKLEYEKENSILLKEYEKKITLWNDSFDEFVDCQTNQNKVIENLFDKYESNLEEEAISNYFEYIFHKVFYEPFNRERRLSFDIETRILTINAELPSVEDMPKVKERKYIKSRSSFKERKYTEKEINQIYDSAVYQYIISLVNSAISHDFKEHVDSININCWVNHLDKGIGKNEVRFIASIFINCHEFLNVDLGLVDPKEWFKRFKGISSNKFSDVTPIRPILNIQMDDIRFIDAVNIAQNIDENTNLASIDWEDFEYLIRELFEKEFAVNGGEVKVTQASSDGGVDAIAFDPDPIKGGKIVIQAKRYTNVVGVSAVRDLAGTVAHEGANKGIIVTTSHYGADSYNFAKDKPITLINGSELLYLLEKHGYKAKIDIDEAKKKLEKGKSPAGNSGE
jgi:restriction system protein